MEPQPGQTVQCPHCEANLTVMHSNRTERRQQIKRFHNRERRKRGTVRAFKLSGGHDAGCVARNKRWGFTGITGFEWMPLDEYLKERARKST